MRPKHHAKKTVTCHSSPPGSARQLLSSAGTAYGCPGIWLVRMKTETRAITLGAAAIAVVASFLAGAYVADGYRTPPAGTFGVSAAVAAAEALPGPKATSAPA